MLLYVEIFFGENLMNFLFKCVCVCVMCVFVYMNNVSYIKGERFF